MAEQEEMLETFKEKSWFRSAVGLLAMFSGIAIMTLLFFVAIPDTNKDALLPLAGIVLGWGGTIVSYEFGSSPSQRKAADKQLGK